jgi:hypothetical protein
MSASPPTRVIFKKAWPFLANDIVADVVQTAIQAFNSRENQKQETYAQHRRERIEAIADQTNDSGGLVRSRGRGTSRIVFIAPCNSTNLEEAPNAKVRQAEAKWQSRLFGAGRRV